MPNRFCDVCGTSIVDGAKFCPNCGKLAGAQATPPPQYAAPAPNYGYAPPPPQPAPNYYQPMVDNSPMSVGQYIVTFILTAIPFVGIIMLFVWAFSSGTNVNKKNYARAILIVEAIVLVLYIFLFVIFGAALFSASSSYKGYY